MGIIRSTFLIKDNKIIKEWRSVKVKDHAKEVLNFLSDLK
jgi:peroxiredoxin Q/BCP